MQNWVGICSEAAVRNWSIKNPEVAQKIVDNAIQQQEKYGFKIKSREFLMHPYMTIIKS